MKIDSIMTNKDLIFVYLEKKNFISDGMGYLVDSLTNKRLIDFNNSEFKTDEIIGIYKGIFFTRWHQLKMIGVSGQVCEHKKTKVIEGIAICKKCNKAVGGGM